MEQQGSGGYQAVASMVTAKYAFPVTRQQAYMWWARRDKNGFPEGKERPTPNGTVQEFHLSDVEDWFKNAYPEPRRERLLCQRQARQEKRLTTDSNESSNA